MPWLWFIFGWTIHLGYNMVCPLNQITSKHIHRPAAATDPSMSSSTVYISRFLCNKGLIIHNNYALRIDTWTTKPHNLHTEHEKRILIIRINFVIIDLHMYHAMWNLYVRTCNTLSSHGMHALYCLLDWPY